MSLPHRSPAPTLGRPAAYGQRPYNRSAVPGSGPMVQRPVATRPVAAHPATGHPVAVGMAAPQPTRRAAVAFLTVTEVAAIMRVSKMTVYRLVHSGDLVAVRVGRSFRVPEPAVRDYLAGARTDVA
jgi:excisionase family DNA binding protein